MDTGVTDETVIAALTGYGDWSLCWPGCGCWASGLSDQTSIIFCGAWGRVVLDQNCLQDSYLEVLHIS